MIKRTLYLENPTFLSKKEKQMVIKFNNDGSTPKSIIERKCHIELATIKIPFFDSAQNDLKRLFGVDSILIMLIPAGLNY